MTRLLLAVLCTLLLAPAARAQDWTTFVAGSGRGALTCPRDPADTADYFCFALACRDRQSPLRWVVSLAGTEGPEQLTLRVEMTQEIIATMLLSRIAEDDGLTYTIDTVEGHAELIDRLADGLRARLHLGEYGTMVSTDIRLRGSRKAIEALDSLCPAPGVYPEPLRDRREEDPETASTYGIDDETPDQMPGAETEVYLIEPASRATSDAQEKYATPLPQPGADAADLTALGADEVTEQIIGRPLSWSNAGGTSFTTFHPDGRMTGRVESGGDSTPNTGTWELREDGQVCWRADTPGCYQFHRTAEGIHAYRSDGGRGLDLGRVVFPDS